jgi:hypothetical protein
MFFFEPSVFISPAIKKSASGKNGKTLSRKVAKRAKKGKALGFRAKK